MTTKLMNNLLLHLKVGDFRAAPKGVGILTIMIRTEASRIALDISRDEASDQNAMTVEVKVRDDTNFEVFTAMLDLRTKWHGSKIRLSPDCGYV